MQVSKIILIGFFTFSKIYGQTITDISVYLNDKQISKSAKDFYKGKFKASDDSNTLSILDSFYTKNNHTRPFYFYLVSMMLKKTDGSLSEALSNSCEEYLERHPDNIIDFLYSTNKLVDEKLKDNWAKIIAAEFMIICEGSEKICIKKSLEKGLLKSRNENRAKLTLFYQRISSYCH